jgi:hypothetical protein
LLALPLIAVLISALGCAAPRGQPSLDSDDIDLCIRAIKQAAHDRDASAVPKLVGMLNSDDPAIRFYASDALERITGQTLGYRFYDDEEQRRAAMSRWKQWLSEQHPVKKQ